MALPFVPLYINGTWRPASTGATFEVRNPASEEVVETAASASAEDCAAAVGAATQAYKTWERSSLSARRDILLKAADILATKREEIRTALREELGAADDWLWGNYDVAIPQLRGIATTVALLKGETGQSVIPGGQVLVQRRAIGVVYGVVPWNAPIVLALRAAAFPIMCGNTVVLKTSEASPRVQAIVVKTLAEAGLPPGVLNCISTSREDAPLRTAEIIAHPMVRKVNFTGSDTVGKLIAIEASKHLKPCVLELGGKAPAVVLDDADVPRAARAITSSALLQSGQTCMSTERIIVQRGAAGRLVEELAGFFGHIKAGNPDQDKSVHIGAMFNPGLAKNAIDMVKEAVSQGAKVLVGDLRHEGAVMQPHLLLEVKPGMRIWERETFAPVAVVAIVDTMDEAIDLANASEYSMAASVWTRDVYKAFEVAGRIRASTNCINGPTLHMEAIRGSGGLGGATGYGTFTVDDWTQMRTIVLHPADGPRYPLVHGLPNLDG
ncbi:aldehyde dehydrogenase [Cubamyces sp. BRFM 1775]|nr:aldehyde dehydrogenase [Cubamyces sp. BRFM 1775]